MHLSTRGVKVFVRFPRRRRSSIIQRRGSEEQTGVLSARRSRLSLGRPRRDHNFLESFRGNITILNSCKCECSKTQIPLRRGVYVGRGVYGYFMNLHRLLFFLSNPVLFSLTLSVAPTCSPLLVESFPLFSPSSLASPSSSSLPSLFPSFSFAPFLPLHLTA